MVERHYSPEDIETMREYVRRIWAVTHKDDPDNADGIEAMLQGYMNAGTTVHEMLCTCYEICEERD